MHMNYGRTTDNEQKNEREVREEKFKNGLFYNNDDSDCIDRKSTRLNSSHM